MPLQELSPAAVNSVTSQPSSTPIARLQARKRRRRSSQEYYFCPRCHQQCPVTAFRKSGRFGNSTVQKHCSGCRVCWLILCVSLSIINLYRNMTLRGRHSLGQQGTVQFLWLPIAWCLLLTVVILQLNATTAKGSMALQPFKRRLQMVRLRF